VPRDRNGSFAPKSVAKRQTRTDDIENRIISMYAKGISTRDIEDQLHDIYGIDASPALISSITDKILPQAAEFQSRGNAATDLHHKRGRGLPSNAP
jgi:putative transposase